ncbi:hypothetical protein ACFQU2_39015 [Siccirubricoccus deserti]
MSGGTLLLDRRRLASLRPLLPDRSPAEWHAALVAEITAGLGAAHAAVLAVPVAEGRNWPGTPRAAAAASSAPCWWPTGGR